MSTVDFALKLREQLGFLETSSKEYDSENLAEALRIATALRVIFHHTAKSTSILMHLNSPNPKLLSTCIKYPKDFNHWPIPNLTITSLSMVPARFECIPTLGRFDQGKTLLFNEWWNIQVIYRVNHDKIHRKNLVLEAANTDGGAHVDSRLNAKYRFIIDGMGSKLTHTPEGGPSQEYPLRHAHWACLRQMAYEVLHSPDLLKLAGW